MELLDRPNSPARRGRDARLSRMVRLKARVHKGRLQLDEPYDAPEGTVVDLAIVDDGDTLDEADRARLHDALAAGHEQISRGEVVPADEVSKRLRAKRG